MEEQAMLKQILALMLERKRILKTKDRQRLGLVEYEHAKTKAIYPVQFQEWAPEELVAIQQTIEALLLR